MASQIQQSSDLWGLEDYLTALTLSFSRDHPRDACLVVPAVERQP